MTSPVKKFYFEEENISDSVNVEKSGDGCYTGPAVVLTETYCGLTIPYENIPGAITPESKNSSNASLISKNSDVKDYCSLQSLTMDSMPSQQRRFTIIEEDVNENPIRAKKLTHHVHNEESAWTALMQMLIPFLIAGLGNVAAGIVLDIVQHWHAFVHIPQLLILVPALLGLKGNVEMTLASRLSTHANMGHMDDVNELKSLIIGNMALVQCQASVVGLIAPFVAIALSFITDNDESNAISFNNAVLVTASSVITTNVANLILGTIMCIVVTVAPKFNINPDNIATPIAASLGDFTTMMLLAFISEGLYETDFTFAALFLVCLIACIPIWLIIAKNNKYTHGILLTGWYPILGAMLLQNTGGLIMENALSKFKRLAAFQPIINGVGGNLAAIQSSRISTYLHKNEVNDNIGCLSPYGVFFGKNPHSLMARILLIIAIPSHVLFLFALYLIKGHFEFTYYFTSLYLIAALIQVCVLLNACDCIVKLLWHKGIDPDNASIPFLTAFADLLGSFLLAFVFFILYILRDTNAYSYDHSVVNSLNNFTYFSNNATLV